MLSQRFRFGLNRKTLVRKSFDFLTARDVKGPHYYES